MTTIVKVKQMNSLYFAVWKFEDFFESEQCLPKHVQERVLHVDFWWHLVEPRETTTFSRARHATAARGYGHTIK